MHRNTKSLKSKLRGASALSYGLVVGLIAVVSLAAVTSTGSSVENLMNQSADAMIGIAPTPVATPTLDPADTTPDAFSFSAINNAALTTGTESGIVQISGIGGSASVSVSGDGSPEYRICADGSCSSEIASWGNGGGTVDNGQYVQMRLTSAAVANGSVTATLDVGGETADFTVTTDPNCPLAPNTTVSFSFTGSEQDYLVPCSGTWELEANAASGGGANSTERGGGGATLSGRMTLNSGDTLFVFVGGEGQMNDSGGSSTSSSDRDGGGFNGGGDAAKINTSTSFSGGGGGGATDFRLNGNSLNDRILVAGGGGGGGSQLDEAGGDGGGGSCGADYCGGAAGNGWSNNDGTNGGLTGGSAGSNCHGGGPGGGGRNSGGAGGIMTCYSALLNREAGGFGFGGDAGIGSTSNAGGCPCGAAGGGGGWYGGGGGMAGCCGGATGAGGSSYWGGASFSNVNHTAGNITGDGSASVTYIGP